MHLVLPLISSVLYVVAAMFLKRASENRVGVWRAAFLCNWVSAFLFLSLIPLGGTVPSGSAFWQAVVVAVLFVVGQLLTFMALHRGDVSVVTPVLGLKVVLVAVFSTLLLGDPVPGPLKAAVVLCVAGVALLNRRDPARERGVGVAGQGMASLISFQAAAAYALFDVLVMKWAPAWGMGSFLPIMVMLAGVMSFIFVPMFREPLRAIPRAAIQPLFWGALCISLQGLILITTLAHFGDATAVNVVYSSRGLWSVLLTWWLAKAFQSGEQHLSAYERKMRLIGAAFLAAAIVLAFL